MKKYLPIGFALGIGASAIIGYAQLSKSEISVTNKITSTEAKARATSSIDQIGKDFYSNVNGKIQDASDNGKQETLFVFRDLNKKRKKIVNKIISALIKDGYSTTTMINNDKTISILIEWK